MSKPGWCAYRRYAHRPGWSFFMVIHQARLDFCIAAKQLDAMKTDVQSSLMYDHEKDEANFFGLVQYEMQGFDMSKSDKEYVTTLETWYKRLVPQALGLSIEKFEATIIVQDKGPLRRFVLITPPATQKPKAVEVYLMAIWLFRQELLRRIHQINSEGIYRPFKDVFVIISNVNRAKQWCHARIYRA